MHAACQLAPTRRIGVLPGKDLHFIVDPAIIEHRDVIFYARDIAVNGGRGYAGESVYINDFAANTITQERGVPLVIVGGAEVIRNEIVNAVEKANRRGPASITNDNEILFHFRVSFVAAFHARTICTRRAKVLALYTPMISLYKGRKREGETLIILFIGFLMTQMSGLVRD